MRFSSSSVIFGLTTAVLIGAAPAQAASLYEVRSGTTSLKIDPIALLAFKGIGLTFTQATDTVAPATGYSFGFPIVPPSSDSSILGSDFSFSYDSATSSFSNFQGAIQHNGSLSFAVDDSKLSLLSPFQLGNFAVGFDNGFFLSDNLTVGGLVLFDLVPTSGPTLTGSNFSLATSVRVSAAFNDLLTNAGGSDLGLTGATIGSAQINAQAVPEPTTMLGMLAGGAMLAASRRRKSAQ